MLHIIGLDHRIQATVPGAELNEGQQLFAQCLRTTIKRVRPVLVAEEHRKTLPQHDFLSLKKLQMASNTGFVIRHKHSASLLAIRTSCRSKSKCPCRADGTCQPKNVA